MSAFVRSPCDEGVLEAARCDEACRRRRRPFVLAAMILGSSMAFIDGTVVHIALPAIESDLNASMPAMQWIVNAYTLVLGSLLLIGGSAGDRFGRRRLFCIGVVVFTVASVACGLAPDSTTLILARALQGLGGALLVPGSLAIIGATFPSAERGRAIGTWAGFSALTTAAGPVLGGWLVDALSWRAIFFINVPLAAVTLALALRYVPESRSAAGGALDWRGALLALAGFALLTYGLVSVVELGFGDPRVPAVLVAGAAALAVFIWVERRAAAPMMPLGLFRSARFTGANLMTLLLYFALSGTLFFLPFALIQVHGYTATAAGAALLPFTLILGVLSRWSGALLERTGARMPLIVGPVLSAAGIALLAVPGTAGSYWTTFFPAMLVLGIGMTISVAPLTTTVMNAVDGRRAGVASGVNNAVSRIAGLLAVAMLTVAAIEIYGPALAQALDGLALPPQVAEALLAARQDLAGTSVPGDLAPALAAQAHAAIDAAFIDSFRVVMLICAAMALGAGLCAALTIRHDPVATAETPDVPRAAA